LQAATLIITMEVAAFQTALLTGHRPAPEVGEGKKAKDRHRIGDPMNLRFDVDGFCSGV
jgi:hypothetical protein